MTTRVKIVLSAACWRITQEIKEAIGLGDLNSDESRKRLFDDELDASSDADSEGPGATDDNDDDNDPGTQMAVEEALHDPPYIISIQPDTKGCAICPERRGRAQGGAAGRQ